MKEVKEMKRKNGELEAALQQSKREKEDEKKMRAERERLERGI